MNDEYKQKKKKKHRVVDNASLNVFFKFSFRFEIHFVCNVTIFIFTAHTHILLVLRERVWV
jgi:hypothetical protein